MIKTLLHNAKHGAPIFNTLTKTRKSIVYTVNGEDKNPKYICKKIDLEKDLYDAEHELASLQMLKQNKYIVNLEDHYRDAKHLYLLMEYCSKGSLFYLENEYEDIEDVLRCVLRNCLLCVLECHKRNIVHGDIKLNNFVVNEKGEVKLIDFGCSAILEDQYQCVPFKAGTPFYISPENVQGIQCLHSDVWSLGITGYYLLTKHHPFSDATFSTEMLWSNILNNDMNGELLRTRTNDCRDLFKRMLDKDPLKRISIFQALNHPFIDSFISS
jgi:serine/threonine protein kinase